MIKANIARTGIACPKLAMYIINGENFFRVFLVKIFLLKDPKE